MDEDETDEGFTIIIDGYSDRTVGQGVKVRGFQSYFKKVRKKRRIMCYLPINGLLTKDAEWGAFYSQNRAGRTAGERGTKISVYSYYQFLKKEPNNPSSFLYYYSIPKGFTQTGGNLRGLGETTAQKSAGREARQQGSGKRPAAQA